VGDAEASKKPIAIPGRNALIDVITMFNLLSGP